MSLTPILAHSGHGAEWQSVLTLMAIGLGVVLILLLIGRLEIEEGGDLVVPLALVALLAAAAPVASDTLSDLSPWAFPVGVVVLIGLIVHATTTVDLTSAVPLGAVVLIAAGAAVGAGPALTDAWIPQAGVLPIADDAVITILSPQEGATVEGTEVTFEVDLTGATLGPIELDGDPPSDPEELGHLHLTIDGVVVERDVFDDCTREQPCTGGTFTHELEPGIHRIFLEFVDHRHLPFQPSVVDGVTIEVVAN